ncbi:unnamed protein product, partial [Laminaria digitata]
SSFCGAQGTPLWCEYLSPWVLRKEFHNVLSAYGVHYVCSERFREGLGPAEDDKHPEKGRFSSGGGGSDGGAGGARAVDQTVFWNLVVHFREQCLPITFLLAEAAQGGSAAPILKPK